MDALKITEAELLDALASASDVPENARTASELAADAGITVKRVLAALAVVKRQGRLRHYRVVREGLDGRQAKVPAYVIVPKRRGK